MFLYLYDTVLAPARGGAEEQRRCSQIRVSRHVFAEGHVLSFSTKSHR
jgi:hypothetical protein